MRLLLEDKQQATLYHQDSGDAVPIGVRFEVIVDDLPTVEVGDSIYLHGSEHRVVKVLGK